MEKWRLGVWEKQAAPEDLYDVAYRLGWDTPGLRDLVYACYKTPDNEENARRFLRSDEFQEAARILRELGRAPEDGASVLDFGCGNGIASYALSRTGYSVIGVDSSAGELAGINAARRIQTLDGAHFEVQHRLGSPLAFSDASFHIVWMREVLHHIAALDEFLAEVHRVLKPSGLLCCLRDVVIWNEDQRRHFFATHPFYPITRDEGCYHLDEYLSAFQGAGFEVARILDPVSSVINTYPEPYRAGSAFDPEASRRRTEGYDLFSFFLRRPDPGAGARG